jgi:hypothetical protein
MKRDLHHILQDDSGGTSTGAVLHIASIQDATSTFAPASVDLAGYRSAEIVVAAGIRDQGTLTLIIKESDTDTAFSAVAAADLRGGSGTIVINSTATASSVYLRGYVGNKRYLQVTAAQTTASNGIPVSVVVLRGHKANKGQLNAS